jgi:hypothetical protein
MSKIEFSMHSDDTNAVVSGARLVVRHRCCVEKLSTAICVIGLPTMSITFSRD